MSSTAFWSLTTSAHAFPKLALLNHLFYHATLYLITSGCFQIVYEINSYRIYIEFCLPETKSIGVYSY